MSYVGKVLTSLAPPLAVPFVAFALRWWLVSPVQAAWSPQGGPPALISGQISLNSWALPVFRMKFLFRLPTRGCKSGRLQNSTLGNTQWLSICSKTANFSWKQIILTPGRIFFFFFSKNVLSAVGTDFFPLKIYPRQLSVQRNKTSPVWRCHLRVFRARARQDEGTGGMWGSFWESDFGTTSCHQRLVGNWWGGEFPPHAVWLPVLWGVDWITLAVFRS